MNKKVLWFIAFLVVAGLSCWATASSFMLIIPLPWYVIWAMTIVFFVFSSYAFKMIMDAVHNDGSIEHPKAKLWGGIALLLLTWVIISLPTNAHTFFYKLQIKNQITQDLTTTEDYITQLARRDNLSKTDSAQFYALRNECQDLLLDFKNEASGTGKKTSLQNIDKYSLHYIDNINAKLSKYGDYLMYRPNTTHNFKETQQEIDIASRSLNYRLNLIADKEFKIKQEIANKIAAEDLENLKTMHEVVDSIIQAGKISYPSAEPIIKQIESVLSLAYSKINVNNDFVYFKTLDDENLYTATNLETRTSRFLHPYKVMGDFFLGKIPFIFIFWIILSILLDVLGFISFDLAFKKEYDF